MNILQKLVISIMGLTACLSLLPDGIDAARSRSGYSDLFTRPVQAEPSASLSLKQVPDGSERNMTVEYSFESDSGQSDVVLSILSPDGRKLLTLVEETQEPGQYSYFCQNLTNDGEPLSTGVYYCLLETGDNTITKRFDIKR